MYIAAVVALVLLLPLLSIALQALWAEHGAFNMVAFARWYVFWAVGMRLLIAGLRQMFQPQYTAQTILGIKSEDSSFLVRELGFANSAIGVTGTLSLLHPTWVTSMALVGAVFYGLAGINHASHAPRNRLQKVAMVADLFAACVLIAILGLI